MKINIATICLFFLLLMIGCTPSIRYTRDQSANQPDNTSSGKQPKSVGGADTLQSGWGFGETLESGAADHNQSDWLSSALSEADQGQSAGAKGGAPRRLEQVVSSYIGVPYKYGGTTPSGFDCSGFASAVYREAYGIQLKRTSSAMWKDGSPVAISAARPGDLVFFKSGTFGAIDHVGIYMGGDRFAHSSTKYGVIYSNLGETYYVKRFAGIRRML